MVSPAIWALLLWKTHATSTIFSIQHKVPPDGRRSNEEGNLHVLTSSYLNQPYCIWRIRVHQLTACHRYIYKNTSNFVTVTIPFCTPIDHHRSHSIYYIYTTIRFSQLRCSKALAIENKVRTVFYLLSPRAEWAVKSQLTTMESFPVLPDLFYCYLNQLVHHTCGGGFRNAKKYYQKAGAERQIQAPPKAKTPKPSAAKGGPKRKSKANKKKAWFAFSQDMSNICCCGSCYNMQGGTHVTSPRHLGALHLHTGWKLICIRLKLCEAAVQFVLNEMI